MFVSKLKFAALIVLVIGVTAGGVLTYGGTATPQAETKAEDPPAKPAGGDKKAAEPIAVQVVKPKKGGLPKSFVQRAYTEAAQRQQLFPLVSGSIQFVAVDIGDRVKKGQVLVTLDSPLTVKDVEQATAALEMAQSRLEEAKVTVAETEAMQKNVQATHFQVEHAKASLKAAQANVRLAGVALDKAKIQEGFTRLRAEFDGVVAERHCDPGNLVQSGANGSRKPLLTLVRIDRLRVRVMLPSDFARVAERGDPVELSEGGFKTFNGGDFQGSLAGDPKDFIAGKIARISPIIDGPGRERTTIIEMANPKNRLVPGDGIGLRIFFNKTRTSNAFTVPQSCVKLRDNQAFVYVVHDGKAHKQKVKLGYFLDDKWDVIEGIEANDRIIDKPGDLKDGTPVKIEKGP